MSRLSPRPARSPLWLALTLAWSGLAQAETELKDVVVSATLSEHETRTAPASVTVVTREEIAARNPVDLLDAVRGEPGITLTGRSVGGRKTMALRGLTGKHVLNLIDGRRISASDDVVGHSDYQYGWLPMAAIERIEVIRGPMSTLYGSEALGGVVTLPAYSLWNVSVGKHKLGLKNWFERHNPHALAQTIERMLEAARQDYWQADPQVVAELKARYRELARRFDVDSDNAKLKTFAGLDGYGLAAAAPPATPPAAAAQPQPPAPELPALPPPVPAPPQIEGLRLDKVLPPPPLPSAAPATALVLGLVMVAGGWRQVARAPRSRPGGHKQDAAIYFHPTVHKEKKA